jgi:hypothetical protein
MTSLFSDIKGLNPGGIMDADIKKGNPLSSRGSYYFVV